MVVPGEGVTYGKWLPGRVFVQVKGHMRGGAQPYRPQGKGGMNQSLRRSEGVSGRSGFRNGVWGWVGDGVCVALITTEIFDRFC